MTRLHHRVFAVAFAASALLGFATNAAADVPGRVGRVGLMQGDVQSYSDSDPTWKAAYLNQPITSRNSIFVGDGGRVEISVGSTTLAMDGGSQVDIQQLDDNTLDANVVRGRVSITVRRLDANDRYQLAVPGAGFDLLRPGRYRVDALDDSSGVTVFSGQASLDGDGGPVYVDAGNALRAERDPSNRDAEPEFRMTRSSPTPIDDWVASRETRFRENQTLRYVSPDTTGYEELEANGRWANEADIGPVWYPTTYVGADWVPYRYGRWAYVAPWGYTWIDDAPWGFAPFHYGRWIQVGPRWGWVPGAYVARPVYAPALVGFYGGGNASVSFSVGVGPAVGWYPLAPWQRYSPHYTQSVTYVNRVNNITIVSPPPRFARRDDGGDGRDWNRFHGGTVVPQNAFASQRSISRVAIAPPREFASRAAQLDVGALPRPADVPAALRQGPRPGEGIGRPDFRGSRDFARRPFGRSDEPDRGDRGDRNVARPDPRPAFDAQRAQDGLQQQRERQQREQQQREQGERARLQPRDDNRRPAVPLPSIQSNEAGPPPNPASIANERFAPRVRPNATEVQTQQPARAFNQEEMARRAQQQEMRNQQRAQQAGAPGVERERERPQIERPRVERAPQAERPAVQAPPVQPPAQLAPRAAPVPQPVQPQQPRNEVTRQKMDAAGIERPDRGGPGGPGGPGGRDR